VSTRIAYLGPAGTFTEDALRNATAAATDFEPLPAATIHDAILAVEHGEADRALVPFENSIEGAVRPTLDTLALEAEAVAIVGEFDYPVRVSLIARQELPLAQITAVLSHPQASAQCARFIREQLPDAEVRATASTADAVRTVSETEQPGPRRACRRRPLWLHRAARGSRGLTTERDSLRVDRPARHRARG